MFTAYLQNYLMDVYEFFREHQNYYKLKGRTDSNLGIFRLGQYPWFKSRMNNVLFKHFAKSALGSLFIFFSEAEVEMKF